VRPPNPVPRQLCEASDQRAHFNPLDNAPSLRDKGAMRHLVACLTICALGLIGPAHAAPDRFDHRQPAEHAQQPCASCHRMSAGSDWSQRGRIGHYACSKCHDIAKMAGSGRNPPPLCYSCHQGDGYRFPPHRRRGASDFVLARFGHADHQRDGNRGCTQCHRLTDAARKNPTKDPSPEMGVVGHETCGESICHGERVQPTMATCDGCHVRRSGEVEPLASAKDDPFRVAWAFSHVGHEAKAGEAACGKCHTNAATGPGEVVPMPPMDACAGCHHGQGVFSTTGIQCGWCHVQPEATGG
jgi:hypothetical protein